jgi:2-polyprenyl-3-methyl-5-hydroxy-6-metoxy-1,4-benzoquinol methylase
MKSISFKEIDKAGYATLEVISKADNLNKWIFDIIEPYCYGDIIEIGSGIGNISRFFIEKGYSIALSDVRENYCNLLKQNFNGYNNLQNIYNIDLIDPNFKQKFKFLKGRYDTLFSLNVIEHIANDQFALENAKFLLKKGGNIIILVPAFQKLFNGFDVSLDHYKRYTKKSLSELFAKCNLNIIIMRYFNFVGMIGWFISGKIQRNKILPLWQMRLFNRLVPIFKIFDYIAGKYLGLSVIAFGKS